MDDCSFCFTANTRLLGCPPCWVCCIIWSIDLVVMSKTSVDRVASGEIAIINSLLGEVSFEERKKVKSFAYNYSVPLMLWMIEGRCELWKDVSFKCNCFIKSSKIYHLLWSLKDGRYRSLTKTRSYYYEGKMITQKTSKLVVSGDENRQQEEHQTRSIIQSHLLFKMTLYFITIYKEEAKVKQSL